MFSPYALPVNWSYLKSTEWPTGYKHIGLHTLLSVCRPNKAGLGLSEVYELSINPHFPVIWSEYVSPLSVQPADDTLMFQMPLRA